MGQSTDGILFYGCLWKDSGWPSLARLGPGKFDPQYWENRDAVADDDVLISLPVEVSDDDGEMPDNPEKEYLIRKGLWKPTANAEENYKSFKALEPTIPFEVVQHCSSEYPMYGLAIRGTVTRAWRGSPKKISMSAMLPYSPSHESKHAAVLREVCAVLKLQQPNPYETGWYLVSDWS